MIQNRRRRVVMKENYCIHWERGVDFVLLATIKPASFRMRKTLLDHDADARFDSGVRVLYDCLNHVAGTVFGSSTLTLESCMNKFTESSWEPRFWVGARASAVWRDSPVSPSVASPWQGCWPIRQASVGRPPGSNALRRG